MIGASNQVLEALGFIASGQVYDCKTFNLFYTAI